MLLLARNSYFRFLVTKRSLLAVIENRSRLLRVLYITIKSSSKFLWRIDNDFVSAYHSKCTLMNFVYFII